MSVHPDPKAEYRAFFADVYADVLRFAQRRTTNAEQAEDAVADAMLVAWRRFGDAPKRSGERRAWLFGIVRNTMLNAARSETRRSALTVRLIDEPAQFASDDHAQAVAQRVDLARAWGRLEPDQQEVLALAVFEQLSAAEAAIVLGISSVAFRTRLARARRKLHSYLTSPAITATFIAQEARP